MMNNLDHAILNQEDAAIVRDGAPSFMLMIDAQIEGDKNNSTLLMAGSKLYGAYASAFVDDPRRARRLSEKSFNYAQRAMCIRLVDICAAYRGPYSELEPLLNNIKAGDVPVIYSFAASWAGWVQANSEDWSALADLPKIKAMMSRIVELNEGYDHGGAHLYLGVLESQLPASLGGKPEQGRGHFEQAITLSDGHNFMAKVLYAQHYARLVFDRELHDRLLHEVINDDPVVEGFTLSNVLAKQQAIVLLESATEYFE